MNRFFAARRCAGQDHTWVTSYDSGATPYANIQQVLSANQHYWYCCGDFHSVGRLPKPVLVGIPTHSPFCLVGANSIAERGTIHRYGIEGVCHQVTNQVLYVASTSIPQKLFFCKRVRGYLLSSSIFGTYGRREAEWDTARIKCGVAPKNMPRRRQSLLVRRMSFIQKLSIFDPQIMSLEEERRRLLKDIDDISFAPQGNETQEIRVGKLNQRITSFIRYAEGYFRDNESFQRMFGINRGIEEIKLIDPELFVVPDPEERPERNEFLGW